MVFVLSFVVHPQIRAEYYPYGQARGDAYYTLRVSLGRVTVGRSKYTAAQGSVEDIEVVLDRMGRGWVVEMYTVRAPFSYDKAWWGLPGKFETSTGSIEAYSVPLVYAIPFLGFALVIPAFRARGKKRDGWCQACGYSLQGIKGEVCPECGVGIDAVGE